MRACQIEKGDTACKRHPEVGAFLYLAISGENWNGEAQSTEPAADLSGPVSPDFRCLTISLHRVQCNRGHQCQVVPWMVVEAGWSSLSGDHLGKSAVNVHCGIGFDVLSLTCFPKARSSLKNLHCWFEQTKLGLSNYWHQERCWSQKFSWIIFFSPIIWVLRCIDTILSQVLPGNLRSLFAFVLCILWAGRFGALCWRTLCWRVLVKLTVSWSTCYCCAHSWK